MLLKWVGGKSRLASEIISQMPKHDRYIEPFFGAGYVFFNKEKVKENLINDKNGDLINLYEVVRDNPYDLIRVIVYTPNSEEEFNKFSRLYFSEKEKYLSLSSTMRALIYFYIIKNSFNGLGKSYSIFGGSWWSAGLLETIERVSNKLVGVYISNRDYSDLLIYGDKDTLIYLDPPYTVTINRNSFYYEYLMSEEEHCKLRDLLVSNGVKYKWLLSYDINPLVDKLYSNLNGVYINKTSEILQSSVHRHERFKTENSYNEQFKREYLISNFPLIQSSPLFNEN